LILFFLLYWGECQRVSRWWLASSFWVSGTLALLQKKVTP